MTFKSVLDWSYSGIRTRESFDTNLFYTLILEPFKVNIDQNTLFQAILLILQQNERQNKWFLASLLYLFIFN